MKSNTLLIALLLTITNVHAVKFTQKILENTANDQNENLPIRVDGFSWLESVLVLDNRVSQFLYKVEARRLTKALKSQGNKIDAKNYINTALRITTINGHCSTPELRAMLNDGVGFLHAYYDMEGKYISEIKIAKKDCH
jgi:hypothetical protein